MQNIFEQVTELPERDTIVTELVETTVIRRWQYDVCGGHTEKDNILCEGRDPRDGERPKPGGGTARKFERWAAKARDMIGRIKTPTYAEWLERSHLGGVAWVLRFDKNLDEMRDQWKKRGLNDDRGWIPEDKEREVLEKLFAMPKEDLILLVRKYFTDIDPNDSTSP